VPHDREKHAGRAAGFIQSIDNVSQRGLTPRLQIAKTGFDSLALSPIGLAIAQKDRDTKFVAERVNRARRVLPQSPDLRRTLVARVFQGVVAIVVAQSAAPRCAERFRPLSMQCRL
jgi:hypothetical protein